MTDIKQTIQELEMLKGYHETIIAASNDPSTIQVTKGCLVAINHAINAIEEMEERIAIMSEDRIFCEDCKYWKDKKARDKHPSWLPCMATNTRPDFYCADGERKSTQTNAKNNALDVR